MFSNTCCTSTCHWQAALESGVQSLADFLKLPEPSGKEFDEVIASQLSFLGNENLIRNHLRQGRVDYNGKPSVAIPYLANMLNPVYDFVQVSSLQSSSRELQFILHKDYNFDENPDNKYKGKNFVMKMSTAGCNLIL